jgi:spermidine/putrescine-binding protein
MTMITRRQALAGAAALGASAIASPLPARAAGKELRMYTWEGYADAEWVKEFEAKHGCKVNAAYAGSVDEMFAKMSASKGADFDIVAVDTSSIPRYIDAGLLAPIDTAKIPNSANLMPDFQAVPVLQKDGKTFGLPFAWGSLGLIYDTEHFKGKEPDSWATLWDPALEGRLIALDDANNNIVTAALFLGLKNPYQLSDDEFKQVKDKLIEQKKLLLSYYAGFDDGVEIWKKNKIVAMFAMGEIQAKKMIDQGLPIKYIIPKENAVGWLDCMLLSSGAKEVDLAHAWYDFALGKAIGADMTKKFNYGNTTSAVAGMDYAKGLSWLQPPEDFNKRINLWNEVKAAI